MAKADHEDETVDDFDRDSLHTLPLSMVPLQTPGLKRARMIKNARYESVVELFKGKETGSGQIKIEALDTVFDKIEGEDFGVLYKLAELPSYDVYSLRIQLREHSIPVNDVEELRLSDNKKRELDDYMKAFTRPLILQVYGNGHAIDDDHDLVSLFRHPDVKRTRQKLKKIAEKLEIELIHVPKFLQDYGDTFLSVSYFRQCLDNVEPLVEEFLGSIAELEEHRQLQQDRELMGACNRMQTTVDQVTSMIRERFNIFDQSSRSMWKNLNAKSFKSVESMVVSNHATMGGILCALSVCMGAWANKFPHRDAGGPQRRADFVRTDMRQGIDNIRKLKP